MHIVNSFRPEFCSGRGAVLSCPSCPYTRLGSPDSLDIVTCITETASLDANLLGRIVSNLQGRIRKGVLTSDAHKAHEFFQHSLCTPFAHPTLHLFCSFFKIKGTKLLKGYKQFERVRGKNRVQCHLASPP